MKTTRAILASLALLAMGAPGIGGGVALAHDDEDYRPEGGSAYRSGYQVGYRRGYRHGYYDAASGLGYENVAASHQADRGNPFFAGMHEGEHVGYDEGFRAGRAGSRHHYRPIYNDEGY